MSVSVCVCVCVCVYETEFVFACVSLSGSRSPYCFPEEKGKAPSWLVRQGLVPWNVGCCPESASKEKGEQRNRSLHKTQDVFSCVPLGVAELSGGVGQALATRGFRDST